MKGKPKSRLPMSVRKFLGYRRMNLIFFAKPLSYRGKEGVVEGSLDRKLPLFLTIEGDDATSSSEDEISPLVLNLRALKHAASGSTTEDDSTENESPGGVKTTHPAAVMRSASVSTTEDDSTEDEAIEPLGSDHEGGGHLCDTESHDPDGKHGTVYQVRGHHIPSR